MEVVIPAECIRAEDTGSFSFIGSLLEQGSTPSRSKISLINTKSKNSKNVSRYFPFFLVKGQETPSLTAYLSLVSSYQRSNIEELRKASYEQILSFKSLDNNWDGFGAIPINVQCATSALCIINYLEEPELSTIIDIFPNTNGSVCIKWGNNNGERLTLSIGADTFSFYLKKNGFDAEFYDNQDINEVSTSFLVRKIKSIIYNV